MPPRPTTRRAWESAPRNILSDSQQRRKAYETETADIATAISVTRPESEPDRNFRLLKEWQRRGRGTSLPLTAGTNLKAGNDELERLLNEVPDEEYHQRKEASEFFADEGKWILAEEGTKLATAIIAPPIGIGAYLGEAAGYEIGADPWLREHTFIGNFEPETIALVGEVIGSGPGAIAKIPKLIRSAPKIYRGVMDVAGNLTATVDNTAIRLTGERIVDTTILSLHEGSKVTQEIVTANTKRIKEVNAKIDQVVKKFEPEWGKAVDDVDEENMTEAFMRELGNARTGKLEKPLFEIPKHLQLSGDDQMKMVNKIFEASSLKPGAGRNVLLPLEAIKATGAYFDFVTAGKVFSRSEGELLGKVFGDEFLMATNRMNATVKGRLLSGAFEVIGVPRTWLSSLEWSAVLFQGAMLGVGRMPKQMPRLIYRMARATVDPKYADDIQTQLVSHPLYSKFNFSGLYINGRGLTGREELFYSSLATKIPILGIPIRASERAYATFLNQLRFKYMETVHDGWVKAGMSTTEIKASLKTAANFTNIATGRGKGFTSEGLNKMSSLVFYAPRLAMSRFQLLVEMPYTAITRRTLGGTKVTPQARKELARSLVQTAATFTTFMGMVKVAGDMWTKDEKTGVQKVTVETDPRATASGKITIGNTQLDFSAGMGGVIRLIVQMATKQQKSGTTGELRKKEVWETIENFFLSKLEPVTGAILEQTTGETYLGDDPKKIPLPKYAWERLISLFIQDVVDAVEVDGHMIGGGVAPLFAFGTRGTSFESPGSIANKYLQGDVVITDDKGNRIYEVSDERLTPAQKAQLYKHLPLQEEIAELQRYKVENSWQTAASNQETAAHTSDLRFANGEKSASDWRQDVRVNGQLNSEVFHIREGLEGAYEEQKPYGAEGSLTNWAITLFGGKNEIDRTPEQQALKDYYDLAETYIDIDQLDELRKKFRSGNNLSPEERKYIDDQIQLDAYQDAQERFLSELSESELDYVLENMHPKRTPTQDLYYKSQRVMKPYWDIPEEVARERYSGNADYVLELWEKRRNMPANERGEFDIQNTAMIVMQKIIHSKQERMKFDNPEIDRIGVVFYEMTPTSLEVLKESQYGRHPEDVRRNMLRDVDHKLNESLNLSGIRRR